MIYKKILNKIFNNEIISKVEPLNKGWSNDTKYYIEDKENNKFLLRISVFPLYDKKLYQYNLLKEISKLEINAPKPLELGNIDNYVYFILSWIEGNDAEKITPTLDEETQYLLGINAGLTLKQIHSIKIKSDINWAAYFKARVEDRIKKVKESSIKHKYLNLFSNYLLDNIGLIKDRPISILHGDYHLGNMLLNDNLELGIIDFDKMKIGDPIYDFKQMIWTTRVSNVFATGLIDGYTDFKPKNDFFKLLLLYSIESSIANLYWTSKFEKADKKVASELFDNLYKNYDGLTTIIPLWYDGKLKIKYKDLK
ncbi:MAG: aminoglycoside phosphotransferase family protein [Acholeplasmataceae bacterium]